jgi:hypothetical protein
MIDFFNSLKNFKFDSSLFLKFSLLPLFLFFLGNPAIALLVFNLHQSLSLLFGFFSLLGFLPIIYFGFISFSKTDPQNPLDSILPLVVYGSLTGFVSGFLNGVSIYLYFGNANPLSFLPILVMPIHGIFLVPCFSLGGYLINLIISRKRA